MIRRVQATIKFNTRTVATKDDIIDWINEEYQFYSGMFRERDYYITTAPTYDINANVELYNFPDDFLSVKMFERIDSTTPYPIYRVNFSQKDDYMSPSPSSVTSPMSWFFAGTVNNNGNQTQQFGLTPITVQDIPASLRLTYDRIIKPLKSATDIPELPQNFHQIIPQSVLIKLGYLDKEYQKLFMNQVYVFLASRNRHTNDYVQVTDTYDEG